MNELARFWSKVDRQGENDCWPWLASRDDSGHGAFYLTGGRKMRAHRYALRVSLGRELNPGALVCHRCNRPECVNPSHLYEGTHSTNSGDKLAAGRQMRGSMSPHTRLTEADVSQIVSRYRAGGVTQVELAAEFQVSQSEVSRMVSGKSWRHLLADLHATAAADQKQHMDDQLRRTR